MNCWITLAGVLLCACGRDPAVQVKEPKPKLSAVSIDAGTHRSPVNVELGAARVTVAQPEGRFAKEAIRRAIGRGADALRSCYEPALHANPSRALYFKVRFVIDPQGRVPRAEMLSSNSFDTTVDRCLLDAFRALKFPSPEGGVSITVTYPLIVDITGG